MKILFLLTTYLLSHALFACSCKDQGTVTENVESSDLVVSGTVISKKVSTDRESIGVITTGDKSTDFYHKFFEAPSTIYEIKIITIYKGETSSETIHLITGMNGAACGVNLKVGETVIIYGSTKDYISNSKTKRYSENKRTFWSSLCTRTDQYTEAEEKAILEQVKK